MNKDNNVHDIFKLDHMHGDSGMNLHAAISKQEELMQNRMLADTDPEELYAIERSQFTQRIISVSKAHQNGNADEAVRAHLELFNIQGEAREKMHEYVRVLNKLLTRLRKEKKQATDRYVNASKKFTNNQVDAMVEGDLADLIATIKVIEDQVNFFHDIEKQTINMSFSIKYISNLNNFMRENS
jgi:hypothetical protein